MKRLLLAVAVAATLPQLTGCFPLIAAGAATAAVSAVDRRTTGAQVEDQQIELRADRAISDRIPAVKAAVGTASYNRRLLLYGQAANEEVRQEATRIAQAVPNVREVLNEIEIAGGAGVGAGANDAVITTKVRASLIDAKDVPGGTIRVVTERGTVFLLGLVSEAEGDRAARTAAGVSGVVKVVKAFEYIPAEDARRMTTSPGTGNTSPSGPRAQ